MTALLPRPPRSRWTSFVADQDPSGKRARVLHEDGNDRHRARVEHDRNTLLVHLSDEDGAGWTCLAVDRATRRNAVGQGDTQLAATEAAYRILYRDGDDR
ncbi:MAG: hypothetical protein ACRDVG_06065 [Jatrophihabitantaceae bacterium]